GKSASRSRLHQTDTWYAQPLLRRMGGFLPFAFGIPEAGSSSIVCRISSARCDEQPLQPLFSIIYVRLLDTRALFLPVRSNLCHLFTLAHPRSAFSLTRKARPQIVILALREPQLILLPIEPLRTATPLHKCLDQTALSRSS